AEDGIRYWSVTGVQTCALPIYVRYRNEVRGHRALKGRPALTRLAEQHRMAVPWLLDALEQDARYLMMQKRVTPEGCLNLFRRQRSEERRVGKERRARGRR